jgi:hypothetical protein
MDYQLHWFHVRSLMFNRSILRPNRQSQASYSYWATAAIALGSGWLGWTTTAIASPHPAGFAPDTQYLAQRVVDGLPPPPPVFSNDSLSPTVSVPAAPADQQISIPESDRYLVVVNGDSPLLLDQVRRVNASAALQQYQGQQIIQAGVFDSVSVAQQQVAMLANQGIGAEVIPVSDRTATAISPTGGSPEVAPVAIMPTPQAPSSTPPQTQTVSVAPSYNTLPEPELIPVTVSPREIEFGRPANFDTVAQIERSDADLGSSYYVVIPGRSGDVNNISAQVIRLGGGIGIASVVDERNEPLGPHVRVGPYVGRSEASRWSNYFRDFGLDARVYYRR